MKSQNMKIRHSGIDNLFEIRPVEHQDSRGLFYESFVEQEFAEVTSKSFNIRQVNTSKSAKGVLRGAHFQTGEHAQQKLVTVNFGLILDVVVDIRPNSPTFGEVRHYVLSGQSSRQLFVGFGLAHSFLALEEDTCVTYFCDEYYNPASEISLEPFSINFDFHKIARQYGVDEILQSEKDRHGLKLIDLKNHAIK